MRHYACINCDYVTDDVMLIMFHTVALDGTQDVMTTKGLI